MHKLLLALMLMLGASICVMWVTMGPATNKPRRTARRNKNANESDPPKKSNENKGGIVNGERQKEEIGKKDSKEEILYKGKPASFWIKQLKDRDAPSAWTQSRPFGRSARRVRESSLSS